MLHVIANEVCIPNLSYNVSKLSSVSRFIWRTDYSVVIIIADGTVIPDVAFSHLCSGGVALVEGDSDSCAIQADAQRPVLDMDENSNILMALTTSQKKVYYRFDMTGIHTLSIIHILIFSLFPLIGHFFHVCCI